VFSGTAAWTAIAVEPKARRISRPVPAPDPIGGSTGFEVALKSPPCDGCR
jgi:hypothetical protein